MKNQERKKIEENTGTKQKAIKCEECGEIKECSWTANPYHDEIHGDETKHWICDDCWQDCADDI